MLCGLVGVLLHSVFESIWEEPYMMALFFAVAGHDGLGRSAAPQSARGCLTETQFKNAVNDVEIPT